MTDLYVDIDHQINRGIVVDAQVVVAIALFLMMVNTLEHRNQVRLLRNVEATRKIVVSEMGKCSTNAQWRRRDGHKVESMPFPLSKCAMNSD
jgi:hypothetical protein